MTRRGYRPERDRGAAARAMVELVALRDHIRQVYLPAADRLWANAVPGGRRLRSGLHLAAEYADLAARAAEQLAGDVDVEAIDQLEAGGSSLSTPEEGGVP